MKGGYFPSSSHQLSQLLHEVSRAGTTLSVLQMTKAKNVATSALDVNYQLCASSERGSCVNSDSTISCSPPTSQALFPAHHFVSWFLKCHLWRMFWRFDLGGESSAIFFIVLRMERRPRNHTWLPALVYCLSLFDHSHFLSHFSALVFTSVKWGYYEASYLLHIVTVHLQ